MLERALVAFALLGAEWVLYLLVLLSIASVAVMIERALFYTRHRFDLATLRERVDALLDSGDTQALDQYLGTQDSMASHVLRMGVRAMGRGEKAAAEVMEGELIRQRLRFERRLIFLGTLGNNAPFIGLFGTVLGIIKAFRDLAEAAASGAAGGNTQAVMAGISEALVATAVGLAVALPAVVAFNYFRSVVKTSLANTESLRRVLTAHIVQDEVPGREGRS